MLLHRYRAGARTAAAVRRRERLVQVQVHHVDAEVAGARDADQRVHVGAVHVDQRAFGVQDFGDARDVFFEHAERVGIGDHQRGDIFVDGARERFDIHHAAIVGLDVLHRVAGHGGGGGIGAVRGIRNQKLLARIALRLKQRADQQDAGELAVRAGGGLQRDGVHAGDFGEHAFRASPSLPGCLARAIRADRDAPRPGLRCAPLAR